MINKILELLSKDVQVTFDISPGYHSLRLQYSYDRKKDSENKSKYVMRIWDLEINGIYNEDYKCKKCILSSSSYVSVNQSSCTTCIENMYFDIQKVSMVQIKQLFSTFYYLLLLIFLLS